MNFLKIVFCIVFLQGCTLQSYLVSQIDTILEVRLQGQLDLYYQQKKALALDLDLFLNQQKAYIPEAQKHITQIEIEKTEAIEKNLMGFIRLYKRSAKDFNLFFCKYLAVLDDSQITSFFKKQVEENDDLKNKISKMNLEKLTERVEFFVGDITPEQRPIIQSYLAYWIHKAEERLQRRIQLQQQLRPILISSQDNKEQVLRETLDFYVESSFEKLGPLIHFLQNFALSLNADQKAQLNKRKFQLLELIESFNKTPF